jgi:hypothetical protein
MRHDARQIWARQFCCRDRARHRPPGGQSPGTSVKYPLLPCETNGRAERLAGQCSRQHCGRRRSRPRPAAASVEIRAAGFSGQRSSVARCGLRACWPAGLLAAEACPHGLLFPSRSWSRRCRRSRRRACPAAGTAAAGPASGRRSGTTARNPRARVVAARQSVTAGTGAGDQDPPIWVGGQSVALAGGRPIRSGCAPGRGVVRPGQQPVGVPSGRPAFAARAAGAP